ncbi:MAG: hypothetical protein MUO26_01375 [Methanotrichaceae archaeon]|nr:hypothetical protein [Methanotrichaceae archaeon]
MRNPVLAAIIASIFCSIIMILLLTNTVIDPYLKATNWSINLFDFYENNNEVNKIYILGDSLAQMGIDPLATGDYLKKNNESFKVYNLHYAGDNPYVRIVELAHMARSKPKIIVFCPQYRWFSTLYWTPSWGFYPQLEDRYSLVADKTILDPYTRSLFNKTQLDLIQKDSLNLFFYKKRYLIPSLQFRIYEALSINNSAMPRITNFNREVWPVYWIKKPQDTPNCEIIEDNNIQKKAFLYMTRYLKGQGIHVIIINMPYHPDYLRTISNESKNNYSNLMNETGCSYYNLDSFCSDLEFFDYGHINYYGRQNLTKEVAEIIRYEVTNAPK